MLVPISLVALDGFISVQPMHLDSKLNEANTP